MLEQGPNEHELNEHEIPLELYLLTSTPEPLFKHQKLQQAQNPEITIIENFIHSLTANFKELTPTDQKIILKKLQQIANQLQLTIDSTSSSPQEQAQSIISTIANHNLVTALYSISQEITALKNQPPTSLQLCHFFENLNIIAKKIILNELQTISLQIWQGPIIPELKASPTDEETLFTIFFSITAHLEDQNLTHYLRDLKTKMIQFAQ